ncbi:hypothetical protein MLD38_002337 [Melastoma candidum]|uniref:Uncharacterized protein n=1 Tax=Melastoma candidum TaxID=119954 RepID=A0ACB9RZ20_9MYRT|nr:hypothetical protein MLD38_002337 [Melastoma candidum]
MCGAENTTPLAGRPSDGLTPGLGLYSDPIINLDHGDPTIFKPYWMRSRDQLVVSGSELMSYFSRGGHPCWFMEPDFEKSVKRLHGLVGNAVSEGRYLVVGTGSSQLYLASLYALCSPDQPHPVSVVCAAPYYSSYAEATTFLKSSLFKWEGDANAFDKDGPYIELVTSPNNPDGTTRNPVVDRGGNLIHDLAYYWPHYTPITYCADHDIMLFTLSKCTGHAGTRIGWAIVKNEQVAGRMVKYLELSSIGVSKESQLRAARILGAVCNEIEAPPGPNLKFFDFAKLLLSERWGKLRQAVKRSGLFTVSEFPLAYCLFFREYTGSHPGFVWMTCKDKNLDCSGLLREQRILTRDGRRFGSDASCSRVSMMSKDEEFDVFLERLAKVKPPEKSNACNGLLQL